MFIVRVVTKAAPFPPERFQHQSALYGIPMHVAKLLHPLLFGEDHEIVENDIAIRVPLPIATAQVERDRYTCAFPKEGVSQIFV